MQQTVYGKGKRLLSPFIRKILLPMKLTVLFLLFFSLGALAGAQSVTLSLHDAPLARFIGAVESQTGFRFVYVSDQLEKSRPVTLQAVNTPLKEVLDICFAQQPLDYVIEDKMIIIRQKMVTEKPASAYELKGIVTNQDKEPLAGVTIQLKNSNRTVTTNENGAFSLADIEDNSVLIISGAEIETLEVPVAGRTFISIIVKPRLSSLDQVIVMAYGETTQRLNTGNITKVTAAEIERQPVSNPLAALQGRVPGMVVTQTSGVPGSAFKVEIRGRSSLDLSLSRNDPLIIIDGVPFEPGNGNINRIPSAANNPISISEGGISPLNTINPADIESIEVLKDGDATAIYGSRGANGVIMITTKKAQSGKLTVNGRLYSGFSRVTRTMDMLNTKEYVEMRREAFLNDNFTPNQYNSMDMLVWDTTAYTDFKKLLIGGTAKTTDAQLSLSGGSERTSFLVSSGYQKETTVYPGDYSNRRVAFHMNAGHRSKDGRFNINVGGSFSGTKNIIPPIDFARYIYLPPNMPLYDDDGNLLWSVNGINYSGFGFHNPMAATRKTNASQTQNFMTNIVMDYEILKDLRLKMNAGYNFLHSDETALSPKTSLDPTRGEKASAGFANSVIKSWLAEPQLSYKMQWGVGKVDILAGASLQQKSFAAVNIDATNFTSDRILNSIGAAGNIRVVNDMSEYRYQGAFLRFGYNYNNRYLLNISSRRDGSSRFGPDKRFANFFSAGGAWIFSDYDIFREKLPFISFGKLRASFGTTGNDQIGDYKYYDLWDNTTQYQNMPGFYPAGLFNPDLSWESTRKFEAAIESGFLEDRILLSASYYNNRSGNQLVNYRLPRITGFSSVVRNLNALVENSGWELLLNSKIIRSEKWNWNIGVNMTLPRNVLLDFPGLEATSYASDYKIGKPLGIVNRYHYLGVDPQTGIYTFEDVNRDGDFDSKDFQPSVHSGPRYYGGIFTSIQYRSVELSVFFEARDQVGSNYLTQLSIGGIPGTPVNQPTIVLDRWRQPGDITNVQKYSAYIISDAALASRTLLSVSDGIYGDASFLRCRNVQLSWKLSDHLNTLKTIGSIRLYVTGQNVFTMTKYQGFDPETQSIYRLPPLKTIVTGIQFTF